MLIYKVIFFINKSINKTSINCNFMFNFIKFIMKTKIEKFEDYSLMKLDGQYVGGEETDEMFKMAMDALKDGGKHLIVDFSDVMYFSSIAIGKIVKLNHEYNLNNVKLILTNVNKVLLDVFKITKVDSLLRITTTLDEALKLVAKH